MNDDKKYYFAVDLDRTLAFYESSYGTHKIGLPIEPMVTRVKEWLKQGHKVAIFTARVAPLNKNMEPRGSAHIELQTEMIIKFLEIAGLPTDLLITANKYPFFSHFIDDKAVSVIPNTGAMNFNC